MGIQLTENLRDILLNKLGIREEAIVFGTVKPDKQQLFQSDDNLRFSFFLRKIFNAPDESYLLMYGRHLQNDDIAIKIGFKVYADLCPNFTEKEPLDLFSELANKFGTDITIGSNTNRFFFDKLIEVEKYTSSTIVDKNGRLLNESFTISNPKNHRLIQEILVKNISKGNKLLVHAGFIISIDFDEYEKWFLAHQKPVSN